MISLFFSQRDKQLHILFAGILALVSVPLAIAASLAKEGWDQYQFTRGRHSQGWCWLDLLADAIGIGASVLLGHFGYFLR